jgi:hypothetical protein
MEEVDKYDEELLATSPPKRKLFAFDWTQGYVSPFRPTSDEVVEGLKLYLSPSKDDVFIDIGCGDGKVVNAIGLC